MLNSQIDGNGQRLQGIPKPEGPKRWLIALCLCLASGVPALAGGPRFVSGVNSPAGAAHLGIWSTSTLQYFTDPGPLAASVSHADADAMVAQAAAVWNVPTSSLALQQGGELGEDVSGANVIMDGTGVAFPADVQTSNEANMPVAVIYDEDGSITDLLLGLGASDPVECRQNAVTESVDDIQGDGNLHHALLILNGRCVGAAPEQLSQMQYQLERAFGRVLGLAWAQVNDNVFTAENPVTADQETYWPVMHPLDVLCGPYTYQCMSNPGTLRSDDLNSLTRLYPVTQANLTQGKQISTADTVAIYGYLSFPTGQGMDWVNITAHRFHNGVMEDWELVSSTTGFAFQESLRSPVTGVQAVDAGSNDAGLESFYWLPAVPLDTESDIIMVPEPVNPLYNGDYALAPYPRPPVTPSGSPQVATVTFALGGGSYVATTVKDAASSCAPGQDGTEDAPAALDPSGWQSGLLCGWGHSSWWSAAVRAGHTWTLEVTATDETGSGSAYKLQPVLGVWQAGDATGTVPTVAKQAAPFNALSPGVTQLHMTSAKNDRVLRMVVSDQFGAGRPDFTYTARMFYADTVQPATLGAGGGQIVLTGMGFRQGNVVQVNGVAATVQTWTPTKIVATAPSLGQTGATVGRPVTVSVQDAETGATTAMYRALTYVPAPDILQLVGAPASLETGIVADTPLTLRVVTAASGAPVAGATVQIGLLAGVAELGICGSATTCTATADSNGLVQTSVMGDAAGSIVISATEVSGGSTLQIPLSDTDPVRTVRLSDTSRYMAAGAGGSWTLQMTALQDGVAMANVPVVWNVSSGLVAGVMPVVTDAAGSFSLTVSAVAIASGSVNMVTGCAWNGVCATWTVYGIDPTLWQITAISGVGQSVAATSQLGAVMFSVTDGAGHLLEGAPVTLYQRVLAWEGICTTEARCPAAPVLNASQAEQISDTLGQTSWTPVQLPGIPQLVQLTAVTGLTGTVTLTLTKTPAD